MFWSILRSWLCEFSETRVSKNTRKMNTHEMFFSYFIIYKMWMKTTFSFLRIFKIQIRFMIQHEVEMFSSSYKRQHYDLTSLWGFVLWTNKHSQSPESPLFHHDLNVMFTTITPSSSLTLHLHLHLHLHSNKSSSVHRNSETTCSLPRSHSFTG